MKSYVFRVVIEEDKMAGGQEAYHAYCPALKGCHTWGLTYDEALANVREAIELYIDDLSVAPTFSSANAGLKASATCQIRSAPAVGRR